jgi:D-alanine-D-alanine ligase
MNIAVVFGGKSSEHDVSLVSATSIIKNINKEKFNVIMIGITKQGEWFRYSGDIKDIQNDKWIGHDCEKCQFDMTYGSQDLLLFGEEIKRIHVDCVFPVLHGKNGEDGTIQGFLTLCGIPFVGCDMLSSAMSMDKQITNVMADYAGIKQAKWTSCLDIDFDDEFIDMTIAKLGFPIFVKPANAGSSVGVSKAKNREGLINAANLAFTHDRKVVFEEAIVGLEVECAVLGNEAPIASRVGSVIACGEFYDYDSKYINESKIEIPANIDKKVEARIQIAAIEIYKIMGCSGLSRIDFFLTEKNEIYFNELNTIPGFTSISMYPSLFGISGISYSDLITKLIEFALARRI